MNSSDRFFDLPGVPGGASGPLRLLDRLKQICPDFGDCDLIELVKKSKYGLHCVMQDFTVYLGEHVSSLSHQQLTALGEVIDDAVSVEDDLENAVSTCLLEHLDQIDCLTKLAPFLSSRAKTAAGDRRPDP